MIIKCIRCGKVLEEPEWYGVYIVSTCECGSSTWYFVRGDNE